MNKETNSKILAISFWTPPIVRPQSILFGKMIPEWIKQGVNPFIASYEHEKKWNIDLPTHFVNKNEIKGNLIKRNIDQLKYFNNEAKRLSQFAKENGVEVIFSFANPQESNIIGALASKKSGLPFVSHFSDPYVDNPYSTFKGLNLLKAKFLERLVIKQSSRIIFTNQKALDLVMKKYSKKQKGKALVIPHCFDPADYDRTRIDTDKERIHTDNKKTKLLYEDLTYKIRGVVFNVYNSLGFGHKESAYQKALEYELEKIGLNIEPQKTVDLLYDDKKVGTYRPDLVVNNKIILELKSSNSLVKSDRKQVLQYLRGMGYSLALIINFGSSKLQIERIINTSNYPRESVSSIRENPSSNQRESVFTISYIGAFYKERNPELLLEALNMLIENSPEIKEKFEVVFVGGENSYAGFGKKEIEKLVSKNNLSENVKLIPPVDFKESLALMEKSDCLVAIDADFKDSPFLPSKVIDYAGAKRHIIGITPVGSPTEEVLNNLNFPSFNYDQKKELALYLKLLISGKIPLKIKEFELSQYEVSNTTAKLLETFKKTINGK